MKSLLYKDWTHIQRHVQVLTFVILLPLVAFVLFYYSIGRPLTGLEVGLVNLDNEQCLSYLGQDQDIQLGCPSLSDVLARNVQGLKNLSCHFGQTLSREGALAIQHESCYKKALESVRKGQNYGVIKIPKGFSSGLLDKFLSASQGRDQFNMDYDIGQIQIKVDGSNMLAVQAIKKAILESLQSSVTTMAVTCGLLDSEALDNPKAIPGLDFRSNLWIKTGGIDEDLNYGLGMMPGIVGLVLHLMAFALTVDQVAIEKEDGIILRQLASGLHLYQMVLSQLIVYLSVTITQVLPVFYQSNIIP